MWEQRDVSPRESWQRTELPSHRLLSPWGRMRAQGQTLTTRGRRVTDTQPIPPWTGILTAGKLHHSLSFHPSTGQQLLPEVRHLQKTAGLCDPRKGRKGQTPQA